jgi:hypothetical protein
VNEWRCTKCDRLLGVARGTGLHIENNRSAAYTVSLPVHAVCRCGTANRTEDSTLRRQTPEPLRPGYARTE